ncbi:LacI family DNA-binding transcriptional regulator [Colwellia sp. E2M01]|uniref:LacI family DNA-binding transcriptional regulator n=1 Tax=Colwellia sp. E2M01 TaxID=2841561 RepID=UPI001C091A0E|nr:LacI family DNA-binding transcriptional regulator [Colwellia sp. E2M01]MBU2872024.1 LacI family DNA-binding transcriptional regulator [Colwellia sp. E2M01]
MKATINDVAKEAGVSIKTVSRVMNNEASVRQLTRDKVQAVVERLNYRPNLAARNLAGTKSYSVAYIYDNPNAYYIIDMQKGILSACKQQGFELLIHPCDSKNEDITQEVINMIKQSRIAGLVLTPPLSEMPEFVKSLLALDVKIVRIMSGDVAPDDLCPCVMVNDRDAAQTITQHLIDLGHRDIAFIAGDAQHMSTIERYKGYRKALKESNIAFDKSLLIEGEYSFDSGVSGANQLLSADNKDTRPTAIFSCNDEIAAGALFAARLMGVAIPDSLSIVGFENSPFSRQTWPKLTTADQPNDQIAEDATNILLGLVRKQKNPVTVSQYVPELIVRDSSAKHLSQP